MSAAPFLLYQILAGLAVALGAVYLAIFRPRELMERLGGGASGGPEDKVWIHAASLGEFEAAWPIAHACGWTDTPGRLIVSCTNSTARRVLRNRLPAGARVRLAPLDFWPCVLRSLAGERPRQILFVETEIWPAWIIAASRRGIPLALASARLSNDSLPRYERLKRFLPPVLDRFAAIGCRSDEDRRRWIAIGAPEGRCFVWGNTKYAVGPARPRRARRGGEAFLLVAGSLRPGEELVLDALPGVAGSSIRLIIAPRHLDRLRHWEEACFRRGLGCRRTSLAGLDLRDSPEEAARALRASDSDLPEVVVVDEMGMLNAFYGVADAAIVGGTWTPVGGHNLFEPARQEVPVLFGPSLSGVRDAAEALLRSGGGILAPDSTALAAAIARLADDPQECARVGGLARRAAETLAGGVERTVDGLRAAGFLDGAAR